MSPFSSRLSPYALRHLNGENACSRLPRRQAGYIRRRDKILHATRGENAVRNGGLKKIAAPRHPDGDESGLAPLAIMQKGAVNIGVIGDVGLHDNRLAALLHENGRMHYLWRRPVKR